jgi:hypothetical protein
VGPGNDERAAEVRAAEVARQAELYGDAATVDDVRLLRQRGYVVVREGQRCRVGNMLCSLAALRAKAARERRLMEARHHESIRAHKAWPTGSNSQPRSRTPAAGHIPTAGVSCQNAGSESKLSGLKPSDLVLTY